VGESQRETNGLRPSPLHAAKNAAAGAFGGPISAVWDTLAEHQYQTPAGSSNILWGAAAAAVGAFVAEAQRKRAEEEAARREADRRAFQERIEKEDSKKGNRILSYKERAKAYQRSLDNFKASLIKSGLTPEEAAAAKTKALLGGSIPSVASVVAAKNRNDAMEAKMAAEDAADEAKWLAAKKAQEAAQTPMPSGLSPEAQQAFLRSSQAEGWVGANTLQLQEEYAHYLADQSEQAKQEGEKSSSNILEKARDWVSSPATWWGAGTEEETVKVLKEADDVPLYLPLIKGISPQPLNIKAPAWYLEQYGVKSIDDLTGPLKAVLVDARTIRALGRTIGDVSMPWTLGIGLGLTIAPNLVTNIKEGNSANQIIADLAVDAGGFIVSEIAGIAAVIGVNFLVPGLGTLSTLGVKLGADLATSIVWDNMAETNNWSGKLSNWIDQTTQNAIQNFRNTVTNALDVNKSLSVNQTCEHILQRMRAQAK